MTQAETAAASGGAIPAPSSIPGPAPADAPLCPLCRGAAQSVLPYLNTPPFADPGFEGLTIAVCSKCGYGHTYPPVPGPALGAYYAKSFVPRYQPQVQKGRWPFYDERSMAQIQLGRLFADFQEGDGFIDVGPGVGISFFSASQLLPEPRMFGVEMNETTIGILGRNLPEVTIRPTLEDLQPLVGDTPIKMMLTSHCLEHFNGVEVPGAIAQAYRMLAPGGVFVVEVPHWDLRRFWNRRKDIPHLGFFSIDAMKHALEAAGFSVPLARTFGRPHGGSVRPELARRQRFQWPFRGSQGHALLMANVPDNVPNERGSVLRAVAVKPR